MCIATQTGGRREANKTKNKVLSTCLHKPVPPFSLIGSSSPQGYLSRSGEVQPVKSSVSRVLLQNFFLFFLVSPDLNDLALGLLPLYRPFQLWLSPKYPLHHPSPMNRDIAPFLPDGCMPDQIFEKKKKKKEREEGVRVIRVLFFVASHTHNSFPG